MMAGTENHSPEEISRLFQVMLNAEPTYRRRSIADRKKDLRQLEKAMIAHRQQIRDAVYADFQKPDLEADLVELYLCLNEIRHTRKNLSKWASPKRVKGSILVAGTNSYILNEPKGVSLIIAPWNFPVLLAIGPLISALAAGCQAVIKPSEYCPRTSSLLSKIINEVFPPEQVAVVQGGIPEATALLEQPFRHIFFTGSPEVGSIVMQAASKTHASVTLELGGKSPVIIYPPCDVKDTAERIIWAKWLNAGQTCIAPDYALVHESLEDRFCEELERQMHKLLDGSGPGPAITGIIHEQHRKRVTALVDDACSKGASYVFNGMKDGQSYPTFLRSISLDSEIMQKEIFGPVLPIIPFSKTEEALSIINERPDPLSLYIFSNSSKFRDEVIRETRAGTTAVNELLAQFYHAELPFGGSGMSGSGRAHGVYGFEAFSNQRSVMRRSFKKNWFMLVKPPYTSIQKKIADIVIRWF